MTEVAETEVRSLRGMPEMSTRRQWARLLARNKVTMAGLVMILIIGFASLLAPLLATHHPNKSLPGEQLLPPSREHLFGTDQNGRDIFSRILYAGRIDLSISLSAALLGMLVGTAMGAVLGFFSGWLDDVGMRVVDGLQAFPSLILAMGVVAAVGPGISNLVFVIALVQMPAYIRLVRGELLSIREREYVEAARCVGLSNQSILFRHVLPNCISPVIVQLSASISYAILGLTALSFIGLGINPPTPEWGQMISTATDTIVTGEWWATLTPGLAIVFSVMAFNLIGDGLQDILDPQRTLR